MEDAVEQEGQVLQIMLFETSNRSVEFMQTTSKTLPFIELPTCATKRFRKCLSFPILLIDTRAFSPSAMYCVVPHEQPPRTGNDTLHRDSMCVF